MPSVDCSGGQDRDTTTSYGESHIPPPKTKNCYLTDQFYRDRCGSANDGACADDTNPDATKGGSSACNADDYGGYCKHNDKFWVSAGPTFAELTNEDLLKRYESSSSGTDQSVRRALRDQERKMTNKIRELQKMGKDPLVRKKKDDTKDDTDENEVHNSVSSILFNVGIASSVFLFIASLSFVLIKRKFI